MSKYTKRPFNKDAYKACDKPAKEIIKTLIEKNSNFVCIAGMSTELFKKSDLIFEHRQTKQKINIEAETREPFQRIKNEFDTIHIPARKEDTEADFYIVWSPLYTEFYIITKKILDKYRRIHITQNCKSQNNDGKFYLDKFIDIPKSEAHLCEVKGTKILMNGKPFRFGK
jgi:hypothetical protein